MSERVRRHYLEGWKKWLEEKKVIVEQDRELLRIAEASSNPHRRLEALRIAVGDVVAYLNHWYRWFWRAETIYSIIGPHADKFADLIAEFAKAAKEFLEKLWELDNKFYERLKEILEKLSEEEQREVEEFFKYFRLLEYAHEGYRLSDVQRYAEMQEQQQREMQRYYA